MLVEILSREECSALDILGPTGYYVEILKDQKNIFKEVSKYACPIRLDRHITILEKEQLVKTYLPMPKEKIEKVTNKTIERKFSLGERFKEYYNPFGAFVISTYKAHLKYSKDPERFIDLTEHLMDKYGIIYEKPLLAKKEPVSYYDKLGFDWKKDNLERQSNGELKGHDYRNYEETANYIKYLSINSNLGKPGELDEDTKAYEKTTYNDPILYVFMQRSIYLNEDPEISRKIKEYQKSLLNKER